MAAIQLAGLASGFDWKTFTDSVIDIERAPAKVMQKEQARNNTKKSDLTDLGTKLASLRTAMSDLSSATLSAGRKATFESANPTWSAAVTDSTPVGTYEMQVTSKASASRLTGSTASVPTVAGTLTIGVGSSSTNISITADQSISSIVSAINSSDAGVTAIYSTKSHKIVLTNRETGSDKGILVTSTGENATEGFSEGAIAQALGLSNPMSNISGTDAEFTVNGLSFTSANNTLDAADHGIPGLTINVDSIGTENITVASSTGDLKTKIQSFITKFNDVADFIDQESAIITTAGKTSVGPLTDNREVQSWLRELRSTAFGASTSGAIKNLSTLGLDFTSKSERIEISDATKLDAALADHPADVVSFFNNPGTGSPKVGQGLATAFVAKLDSYAGADGTGGALSKKIESYTKANTILDDQIASLDRYLAQRRSQLEAGFMAMENAQSKLKQMQTQLTNAFPNK